MGSSALTALILAAVLASSVTPLDYATANVIHSLESVSDLTEDATLAIMDLPARNSVSITFMFVP